MLWLLRIYSLLKPIIQTPCEEQLFSGMLKRLEASSNEASSRASGSGDWNLTPSLAVVSKLLAEMHAQGLESICRRFDVQL